MIHIPNNQQTQQQEQTENKKLLYIYLSKLFNQQKAKELMLKHKDNLFGYHGLAYSVGLRSVEFFCLYFLQDTFTPKQNNSARKLAPFHYEIWSSLQDMFIDDSFDKLELIMPRGASKTTTCDFAIAVYAHAYKKSAYTIIAGKTEQDAIELLTEIRKAFEENEYIKNAFGNLIDTKRYTVNKLELELTNSTKIQGISSSSSLRGKKYMGNRPSIIIADDYQGKVDVLTQEARDKKYNTWQQDSQYAGDKAVFRESKKVKMATKFIVLGTILHRDCFISRLLNDNSYKHITKRAVLIDDVDKLFNTGLWAEFKKIYFNSSDSFAMDNAKEFFYANEQEMKFSVLWEDKWSCLDLVIDYYSDPTSFKQELQNDASKIGEKAFHQITTKLAEEIEQQLFDKTMLLCDPAVEVKSNNDFTALLVGGRTANNFRWVRKGIVQRLNFDDYINKVIDLLNLYDDISHVWVEKNTYNGADVREIQKRIDEDINLKSRNIKIINERQFKNKEAKIRAVSGKVDSGFIIFNADDTEFNNQVLNYEGEGYSLHDDAPDVLAEFDRLIDNITTTQKLKFFDKSLLFGK